MKILTRERGYISELTLRQQEKEAFEYRIAEARKTIKTYQEKLGDTLERIYRLERANATRI